MGVRRLLKNLDVVAAVVLFVLSGFGAFYLNHVLKVRREQSSFALFGLSARGGSYAIMSDDGCVGTLSVRLDEQPDATSILAVASLAVTANERPIEVSVNSEMNFSALGQLSSGLLTARAASVELGLGFLEIDPIRAVLWLREGDATIEKKEFTVPGPVELERSGGELKLRYRAASSAALKGAQKLFPLLEAPLRLRFQGSDEPLKLCSASTGKIDLNKVANSYRALLGPLGWRLP